MIEGYFMGITSARFTLTSLNMTIDDAEMICLCLVQFIKNDEMNEPCEKWEDSTLARTYMAFREFFVKQIIRIEGRKGTLATANISNMVEDSTKQATKILSGEILVQAEGICELRALMERNAAPGNGIPSLVDTDTSPVISSQFQAIKVKLDSLKAAATAAAAAVKKTDTKKKKQNDNDIPATTINPYKQRPVRQYTNANYCHSCGFDLADKHTSASCTWKKEGHNVLATITNRLSGTCKNCFH